MRIDPSRKNVLGTDLRIMDGHAQSLFDRATVWAARITRLLFDGNPRVLACYVASIGDLDLWLTEARALHNQCATEGEHIARLSEILINMQVRKSQWSAWGISTKEEMGVLVHDDGTMWMVDLGAFKPIEDLS